MSSLLLCWSVCAPGAAATAAAASAATFDSAAWDDVDTGGIPEHLLRMALGAAACAMRAGDVAAPRTLTVIDYSRPSVAKRLWVLDLEERRLLYEELVAHGQGSGGNLSTQFSNEPDSHQSSIGLFRTDKTYVGKNGYSLRLDGLDKGFNDRARERAIVMHGAPYVSASVAQKQGRLGRSWGCPALNSEIAREVIDQVKGNGLLFAYYPDREWLAGSRYLGDCTAAAS